MLLGVVLMGTLYINAAAYEERVILEGPLSEAYLDYQTKVGMFFPKWSYRKTKS
jgi:protein-S-isoprenylcysteine O-methyltransferase Ste14